MELKGNEWDLAQLWRGHKTLRPRPWGWQQTWLSGAAALLSSPRSSRGRPDTACSLHGGAGGREDGQCLPPWGPGAGPRNSARGAFPPLSAHRLRRPGAEGWGRPAAGRELQVRCLPVRSVGIPPAPVEEGARRCLAPRCAPGQCPRSGAVPPEARSGRRCAAEGRQYPRAPAEGRVAPRLRPRPLPGSSPASHRAASAGEPRLCRAEPGRAVRGGR